MKDVLSTSRVVMQFINDLDDIIQVLKNVFETTISWVLFYLLSVLPVAHSAQIFGTYMLW